MNRTKSSHLRHGIVPERRRSKVCPRNGSSGVGKCQFPVMRHHSRQHRHSTPGQMRDTSKACPSACQPAPPYPGSSTVTCAAAGDHKVSLWAFEWLSIRFLAWRSLSGEQIIQRETDDDRKSWIGTVRKQAAVAYFNTLISEFTWRDWENYVKPRSLHPASGTIRNPWLAEYLISFQWSCSLVVLTSDF